jgi:hypothetical protein
VVNRATAGVEPRPAMFSRVRAVLSGVVPKYMFVATWAYAVILFTYASVSDRYHFFQFVTDFNGMSFNDIVVKIVLN